jgi:ketosteroid isomerase-like protein
MYRRTTMSSPIDVVTGFLRSFTRNDPDYIASFVAEGFRNVHESALGSGCVGREEYRRRLPHFLAAFSDRAYSIDDIVEQQRPSVTDVVVRYRFGATYEGTAFEIPGVMWFSVRDDVITKRVDTWDSLTFLRQTNQTDL